MSDFDNFRWDLFVTLSSTIREPLAGAISNQSHPKVGKTTDIYSIYMKMCGNFEPSKINEISNPRGQEDST